MWALIVCEVTIAFYIIEQSEFEQPVESGYSSILSQTSHISGLVMVLKRLLTCHDIVTFDVNGIASPRGRGLVRIAPRAISTSPSDMIRFIS